MQSLPEETEEKANTQASAWSGKKRKRKVEERVLMVEASDKNGRQMLQRVAGIII